LPAAGISDASHKREKLLSAAISKMRSLTAQRGAEVMGMDLFTESSH